VHMCTLKIVWHNVIVDFSPKSEAYTINLGHSEVLDILRTPKLCDGSTLPTVQTHNCCQLRL